MSTKRASTKSPAPVKLARLARAGAPVRLAQLGKAGAPMRLAGLVNAEAPMRLAGLTRGTSPIRGKLPCACGSNRAEKVRQANAYTTRWGGGGTVRR
jgi:hypothetical protein